MEWMRDGSWQFYGVIVSVIAAIAAIVIPRLQQGKRDLRYDVVYNGPLFLVADSAAGKIRVTFENKPLSSANLILLTINNAGDTPINPNDYEQSMIIFFADQVQVLYVDVMGTKPDNIKTSASLQNGKIEVAPTLLNKGEAITIKIITSKQTNDIYIDSRIAGISEAKPQQGIIRTFIDLNSSKIVIFFLLGLTSLAGFQLFSISDRADIADLETALFIIEGFGNIGLGILLNGVLVTMFILLTYGGYTKVGRRSRLTTKKNQVTQIHSNMINEQSKVLRGKHTAEK